MDSLAPPATGGLHRAVISCEMTRWMIVYKKMSLLHGVSLLDQNLITFETALVYQQNLAYPFIPTHQRVTPDPNPSVYYRAHCIIYYKVFNIIRVPWAVTSLLLAMSTLLPTNMAGLDRNISCSRRFFRIVSAVSKLFLSTTENNTRYASAGLLPATRSSFVYTK